MKNQLTSRKWGVEEELFSSISATHETMPSGVYRPSAPLGAPSPRRARILPTQTS